MSTDRTPAAEAAALVTWMARTFGDTPVQVGQIASDLSCPVGPPIWATGYWGHEVHCNRVRRRLDRAFREGLVERTRSGPGAGGPWLWRSLA